MKEIAKYIFPLLKPHKYRLILFIFVFGAIISVLRILQAPLLKKLIDDIWIQKESPLAYQIPILMSVLFIIAGVFRFFHLYAIKYTADVVTIRLRQQLLKKYLNLDISFFQGNESGSGGLISRLMNDLIEVQNGIHKIADFIREPFMALFAFSYLLIIDWKLTAIIMIFVPIIILIVKNVSRSIRKYSHKNQESMEILTKFLKESLDGTRIIQSFNLQEKMNKRYSDQADIYLDARKKLNARLEFIGPLGESLGSITFSIILVYVGSQIYQSKLTVGDFMGFTVAVTIFQDAMRKLQAAYTGLQTSCVALERFNEIIETHASVENTDSPVLFPSDWSEIEFKDVSLTLNGVDILKNISFKIDKNKTTALVGLSGSGKSSIINLLERFFKPTYGEILINGLSIESFDLKEYRNQISLVSQDIFLFADTIKENLITSTNNHLEDNQLWTALEQANAKDFVENLDDKLSSQIIDFGSNFSGGEKQRLSIARAILKNSPILLLDEATSALDSKSTKDVQTALNNLAINKTCLIISHQLSNTESADKIIYIDAGKILEIGSHTELMAAKKDYFSLYSNQR